MLTLKIMLLLLLSVYIASGNVRIISYHEMSYFVIEQGRAEMTGKQNLKSMVGNFLIGYSLRR